MKYAGLIVGLGNPGSQRANHRHNIGFMAVDRLRERALGESSASIETLRSSRVPANLWSWRPEAGTSPWLLAQPMNFMNRSGQAVAALCRRSGLTAEHIAIVHDELDLPLGRIRFKRGGGLAGHNGLKSVAEALGTRDFDRLRLGIGRPDEAEHAARYVLSPFQPEERDKVGEMLDLAVKGLMIYALAGIERAMNELHSE